MNFTRLRYFHAVAKLQSFRRAADMLGISQPSLSRQIQILEHECNAELLKRIAKRIVLTPAGEMLFVRLGKLLEDMDDLHASMTSLESEQRRRLRLGAIQSTLDYPISRAISVFRGRYPKFVVSVRGTKSSDIIEGVSRGSLDVGIIATPVADPRILVEPIIREKYFVVLPSSHARALAKRLELSDLVSESLITVPRGFVIRDMMDLAMSEEGVIVPIIAEIESIEAIKSMVRNGLGISILPGSATLGPTSASGLCFIPVNSTRLVRDIVAARLASQESNTPVSQFVDILKHIYREERK